VILLAWLEAVGIFASGVAALMTLVLRRRVHELHLTMNSRLDELVKSTHAQGVGEGIQQERDAQRGRAQERSE